MRRVATGCGEAEGDARRRTSVMRKYPVQALRARVACAQKAGQFQQQALRGKQQGLDVGGLCRQVQPAFEIRGWYVGLTRIAAPAEETVEIIDHALTETAGCSPSICIAPPRLRWHSMPDAPPPRRGRARAAGAGSRGPRGGAGRRV